MKNIIMLAVSIIFIILTGCHNKKQPETRETGAELMINLNNLHNEIKLLIKNNAKIHNANLPVNSEHSIEQIVYDAIINKLPENINNNIRHLRTLYDEKINRYWIEFYDTESHVSFLWLGFVVIDGNSLEILHTETDINLYSGVTPEMGAGFRKSQNDGITNEYGNFLVTQSDYDIKGD